MIKNLISKRDREEGFTLIELMVVVLIIAILVAIAIPTFLGARERAQDRAAQSSLRNALTAAKTIFTDEENYRDADSAALLGVEPSLQFNDTSSTGQNVVGVNEDALLPRTVWQGVVLSNSGKCFYIQDNVGDGGPGTQFASGTSVDDACAVSAIPGVTSGEWADRW